MKSETEFIFRPAEPRDIKFILNSWKQSWRVSPWAGVVRNDEYYAHIQSTIEGLFLRGATLEVATRNDRLVGFVCREVSPEGDCIIHYLYVKDPYIATGVGKTLVARSPGKQPGFYTFRYRQVAEACPFEDAEGNRAWRHAPEIARRK